jgi:dTDP-4-amino-4,6-dideoxygalactose transaminase
VTIFFANPAYQFRAHKKNIESAIERVINSNQFILGSEVNTFEENFAKFIGTKSAIGVANGTDAIEIAIEALGLLPGDEIITVSHTAVATVAAIENVGVTPILVDIDPDFFTLDPEKLNAALSPKTRAVLIVHLYGQPGDLETILNFCTKNNLYLIEDVSQAHGAKFNNKRLGSFGDIACFSCYPTKNLGAIGDAGIITTNNLKLAEKVKLIREYGWEKRYESKIRGRNSRLDEIQAAILNVKLEFLDSDNQKRLVIANLYLSSISSKWVKLPKIRNLSHHVFHLFVIQTDFRDDLIEHLKSFEIIPGIHYPVPIHLQEAYKNRIKISSNLPVTEKVSKNVLSLPMYPELQIDEVKKVIEAVNSFRR